MLFEIQSAIGNAGKHAHALLAAADASARIAFENPGRFRFDGALTRDEVVALLGEAGITAVPLAHERGGSTCCGGCG